MFKKIKFNLDKVERSDIIDWINYVKWVDKKWELKTIELKEWVKKVVQAILYLSKKYEVDILNEVNFDQKIFYNLLTSQDIFFYWLWKKLDENFNHREKRDIVDVYMEALNNSCIVQEVSLNWDILNVNKFFEELTWYSKEEIIWKNVRVMNWKKYHIKKFWETLWNHVLTWKVWSWIIKNEWRDWKPFFSETTITPVKDSRWNVVKFIVVRHDVTKLKEIQDELKSKNRELEMISLKDPLTWLNNRRSFNNDYNNCIDDYNKFWKKFVLSMMDVDNFRNFNNTYWHDAWDKVLSIVSNILKENLREEWDIAFRYWWEEFLIILKWIDIEKWAIIIERIRQLINDFIFIFNKNWENVNLKISASFWVWEYNWEEKEEFLKKVDDAMYVSKNNWRNQINRTK